LARKSATSVIELEPLSAPSTVNIGMSPIVTTQYAAMPQKNSQAIDSTTLSMKAIGGGRMRLPNG
jgi:hypothetical protein